MPTDTLGNYSLPNDPAVNITVGGVQVSDANSLRNVANDIANALTERLTRDGKGAMLADLDFGGHKGANLANAVAPTDAVPKGQLAAVAFSGAYADVIGTPALASQAEALAGVDNAKTMTALRTRQAIFAGPVTGPDPISVGAAITSAGYAAKTGRNTTATGPDLIASAFPNYNGYDAFRTVGELPAGSTVIQLNGQASFVKSTADSIGVGFGGLAVSYFGAAVVAGNGPNTSQRTGAWFGNGAILDDLTPGNYYGSSTNRAMTGLEMDFYNYHDDTLVTAYVAGGNSRVQPGQSLAYVVGNMSQVQYFTGTTVNGSTTISSLSNPSAMFAGMHIAGSGIPAKSHVVSVNVGAATCVINNAATIGASGVLLNSSIPWDYAFVSQNGAATNAVVVGLLDGHSGASSSYSQYVSFSSKNSGVAKSTTLQAVPGGDLYLIGGGFRVGPQIPGGASSYSNYLKIGYGTGSGEADAYLQVDPTGRLLISGAIVVGSSYAFASSVSFFNGAGGNTATLTNAPVSGNPTKWIQISDNGVTRYIPAW